MSITSKVAINKMGEIEHLMAIPTSNGCHPVVKFWRTKAHLQVLEVIWDKAPDAVWHLEELRGIVDKLMWHLSICVREVKPKDVKIFLFKLGQLDLLPNHRWMLHTPWEAWDPYFLAAGVNIAILGDVVGYFPCQQLEHLSFNVAQASAPELADKLGYR